MRRPAALQLALGSLVAALYVVFLFGWRAPPWRWAASQSLPKALIRRY